MRTSTWNADNYEELHEQAVKLMNSPANGVLEENVETLLAKHAFAVCNNFHEVEENWPNVAVYNAGGESVVSVWNEDNAEEMPLAKYVTMVVTMASEDDGPVHFWKTVRWATYSD